MYLYIYIEIYIYICTLHTSRRIYTPQLIPFPGARQLLQLRGDGLCSCREMVAEFATTSIDFQDLPRSPNKKLWDSGLSSCPPWTSMESERLILSPVSKFQLSLQVCQLIMQSQRRLLRYGARVNQGSSHSVSKTCCYHRALDFDFRWF